MKTARLLVLSLIVLSSVAAFAQSAQIVAQVTLLNHSTGIFPTPVYTPVTGGVYRISVYMVATALSNFPLSLTMRWTDEVKLEQTPPAWVVVPRELSLYSQATQIVRAAAGKPITYAVTGQGRGQTYDLFITVEQLESD